MTSKSVAEKASSFYVEPMILIFYDLFFVFGVTFLFGGTFKIVRNLPDRSCEICLSDFVAPIHHQKICQHLSQRSIRSVTKEAKGNVWSVRVQDPWQPLTASIKTWELLTEDLSDAFQKCLVEQYWCCPMVALVESSPVRLPKELSVSLQGKFVVTLAFVVH